MAGTAKKVGWINRIRKEHKMTTTAAEQLYEAVKPFKVITNKKIIKPSKTIKKPKDASKTITSRRTVKHG